MGRPGSLNVAYDRRADVLYLTIKSVAAARGVEDHHGIVWRYAEDGSLVGATIQDFCDMWRGHLAALADEIARHSGVSFEQAKAAVDNVERGCPYHE